MSLSVVINTKNSAATLGLTLKSIKDLADEIVVVDMQSTDDTKVLAQKYTDKVFDHPDVGYVEPARNYAIQKATQAWVLIVDADEEVPEALKLLIKRITQGMNEADCYYLPRKNVIFKKWIAHTGWWPDYVLRLFKRGAVSWANEIHSIPITTGNVKELPAQEEIAIVHHNYQNVSQYVSRLNRYTSIEAKDTPTSLQKNTLFRTFGNQFFTRYFDQKGYQDQQHGLALSLLQSFYEVITSLKVWELSEFTEDTKTKNPLSTINDLRQFQRDLNYWIADYYVTHSRGLANLGWRLRRKFKI